MSDITSIMNATSSVSNQHYYYRLFRRIHGIIVQTTLPYIFLVAAIGLLTNTITIILLSKNSITKNLTNKWTLIALGKSRMSILSAIDASFDEREMKEREMIVNEKYVHV